MKIVATVAIGVITLLGCVPVALPSCVPADLSPVSVSDPYRPLIFKNLHINGNYDCIINPEGNVPQDFAVTVEPTTANYGYSVYTLPDKLDNTLSVSTSLTGGGVGNILFVNPNYLKESMFPRGGGLFGAVVQIPAASLVSLSIYPGDLNIRVHLSPGFTNLQYIYIKNDALSRVQK